MSQTTQSTTTSTTSRPIRKKRWRWTLNNYTETEIASLQSLARISQAVTYLVYGHEVAPTTGTPHLQGYVEVASLKTLLQMKTLLGQRVSLRPADMSSEINKKYCLKENGQHWEHGTMKSGQGHRTDLDQIRSLIDSGATQEEIAKSHFSQWIRYRQSFQAYQIMTRRHTFKVRYDLASYPEEWRNLDLGKVSILWGESGIGKTKFIQAALPKALMVSHLDELATYNRDIHEGIIFDDMSFLHHPRTAQIHLLDWDDDRAIHIRYTTAVIPAETPKVFLTNEELGMIFDLTDKAIRRRVRVYELKEFEFQ